MTSQLKVQHRRLLFISLTSLCLSFITQVTLAQEYLWPTDASNNLTSSFAESRSDHFHAGVDIKTWGQEGYHVYATRSGTIWKVQISPFGYGKVIYQILDTGEIAVYAHLQKFSPNLEQIMWQEQNRQQRYSVTKIFAPSALPVKQGELLAYTGRTGIGYPHLHFELRKNESIPINPLQKNYPITDSVAPLPQELAVIPLSPDAQINSLPTPQIYSLRRLSPNSYGLAEPVQVWGTIALAINAYDQADGVSNRFAIYHLSLMLDDKVIFQSTYNEFNYDKTNQIVLDRNFWLTAHTGKSFYNLYVESGNYLTFYPSLAEGHGILNTPGEPNTFTQGNDLYSIFLPKDPGVYSSNLMDQLYLQIMKKSYTMLNRGHHRIKIILQDYYGNQSTVVATIIAGEKIMPKQQWLIDPGADEIAALSSSDFQWSKWQPPDHWQVVAPPRSQRFSSQSNLGQGVKTNRNSQSLSPSTLYRVLGNQNDDIPTFPIYLIQGFLPSKMSTLHLETTVRDPYTVFTLTSAQPVIFPVFAQLNSDRLGQKLLPVTVHDLRRFTVTLPTYELSDDSTIFTLFSKNQNGDSQVLLRQKFSFTRVDLTSTSTVTSPDKKIELSVPSHASNQNLYFSIQPEMPKPPDWRYPDQMIVPLYNIQPTDAPLLKQLELIFLLPIGTENFRQIGVYGLNSENHTWNFIGNSLDSNAAKLKAKTKSLGYFTLLRDSRPPQIYFLSPKAGAVTANRTPEIRVQYQDDLANIGGEDSFRLTLDGQFCIAELDPELRQIKYQPEAPLPRGKHTLSLWIKDRAGNQNQQTLVFSVGIN